MTLAVVRSRGLWGMSAPAVTVEVHLANGLPSFSLVGLADTEVKEARERVRSALLNCGLEFPHNKKIVVNLAPADLPKDSGRFDLPIAIGILAASGQIPAASASTYEMAGELSLAGDLRPIRGALAMSMAAALSGEPTQLILPTSNAEEASLAPGVTIYGAKHLMQVVAHFSNQANAVDAVGLLVQHTSPNKHVAKWPDFADVKGQAAAKRALEIAAAGGHSILMVGPPGSGKSMLAQRFGSILPPLSAEQALECAALHDLAGRFKPEAWGRTPLCAPHHTASAVALVGGGSPPRPGEITLSHHGTLFLDEFPEFSRAALEALREPLETGQITVSRAAHSVTFPAKFQLLAAMNPCPCGYLGSTQLSCRCTPDQVTRYQGKLSGPLLDRIDLQIEVSAIAHDQLLGGQPGERSNVVAQRVQVAQDLAKQRQGKLNARLEANQIDTDVSLEPSARAFLQSAATRLGWSSRGTLRAVKVARTIADLAECGDVGVTHVAEAIQYRRVLRPPVA